MTLRALTAVVATEPTVAAALERVGSPDSSVLDLTAPATLRPFLALALAAGDEGRRPPVVLVVTATGREADEIVAAARCLVDDDSVVDFPGWETLPHERLSPRADTVGTTACGRLRRLLHPQDGSAGQGTVRIVVAPVRSVLQPQVKGLGDLQPVSVREGDAADLEDVVRRLSAAAYHRVDLVERRGEFAVRGGIVDVFPPTQEHPLRVEFWGDTVEEVRTFAVADQRSLDKAPDGLWAPPCRELLLTGRCVRARAARLATLHPELREMLDRMAQGQAVEGMESRAPVLVDEKELLVELLPVQLARWCSFCDPERESRLGRTTWWRPARSSCTPPGRRPLAVGRRRSTSERRPTGRSARCGPRRSAVGWPGGPSPRSAETPTPPRSPWTPGRTHRCRRHRLRRHRPGQHRRDAGDRHPGRRDLSG